MFNYQIVSVEETILWLYNVLISLNIQPVVCRRPCCWELGLSLPPPWPRSERWAEKKRKRFAHLIFPILTYISQSMPHFTSLYLSLFKFNVSKVYFILMYCLSNSHYNNISPFLFLKYLVFPYIPLHLSVFPYIPLFFLHFPTFPWVSLHVPVGSCNALQHVPSYFSFFVQISYQNWKNEKSWPFYEF